MSASRKRTAVELELVGAEPYLCAICLEVAQKAVNTDCGHLFCLKCWNQAFLNSGRCPTCRQ